MMITLAIETATSVCSAALLRDDEVIAEVSEITDRRHNETLPDMILGLLQKAGIAPGDIRLVAVSIGPGSFTGLRVGLSFAKGWAITTGATLSPVGTLDALAERLRQTAGEDVKHGDWLCPMTVARKGEAFGRGFWVLSDGLKADGEPFIVDGKGFEDRVGALKSDGKVYVWGEGAEMLFINQDNPPFNRRWGILPGVRASAREVGKIGYRKWVKGDDLPDWKDVTPLYLKEFTVKVRK